MFAANVSSGAIHVSNSNYALESAALWINVDCYSFPVRQLNRNRFIDFQSFFHFSDSSYYKPITHMPENKAPRDKSVLSNQDLLVKNDYIPLIRANMRIKKCG